MSSNLRATVSPRYGHRAALWLLLLIAPAWAVGTYYSLKVRSKLIQPQGQYHWRARYAKLRPHLAGEPRILFVYDRAFKRQAYKRLFRAQYVLAPSLLAMGGWNMPKPRREPMIYDFRSERSLDLMLARMAAKAKTRRVAMETVRVGRGLALVRMSRMAED